MSRFYNDYTGTDDLLYMNDFLEHYGRKGMKWGQHLPDVLQYLMGIGRYKGKTRKQAKSMRLRKKNSKKIAKKKAQAAKVRSANLEKARAAAKVSAEKRKKLDDIIKKGNAEDILKVASELSPKQKEAALNQLKFRSALQDYNQKDIQHGYDVANNIFKSIGNAADAGTKVLTAVNTGANVYQTLTGTRQKNKSLENATTFMNNVENLGRQVTKESGSKSKGTQAMIDAMTRWQAAGGNGTMPSGGGSGSGGGGGKKKKKGGK